MEMKKEINLDKLQVEAETLFYSGFSCSESLVASIRNHFELDISEEVIAMATGFSGGMGGTGCVCGALAGGVMVSGLFFGRTDPKGKKNVKVSKELHDYFREAAGKKAVCCRVLTRGFDKAKGEHREQCAQYVGIVARKVGEIIVREFQVTSEGRFMLKRIILIGAPVVIAGIVLHIGRTRDMDHSLTNVLFIGIMAIGFVFYALYTIKDLVDEHKAYKSTVEDQRERWENAG